ncbi:MAG: endonuclease/exonuclease/phosphatase family protein [Bacteroidales bacterium]|jgi:endonuclease/exonuclease/phosphatase family metal-dependent hydrolase|nr:endonuclease/exonuclease/phosphatase family protein [Bacteroidales bacterium]
MSYNIHIGIGMDDVIDLERIAKVIIEINPDFVGLQEVDSITERVGWVDQISELARLTGMYPIFAPATERSKGLYGIAALSREKPVSFKNIPLPGVEEPRTFLVVEYKDYLLCNTHFSLEKESRIESVEILDRVVKSYSKPVILTGDFNMLPDSEEINALLVNWELLTDPEINTFRADRPTRTIDYILGYKSKGYLYEVQKAVVVNEPVASDHLPIYIDVQLGHQ